MFQWKILHLELHTNAWMTARMIWMKFWVTNNVITDQAQYVAVTAIKMVTRSAASSTDMITAPLKGKKCAVALFFFLACFPHCWAAPRRHVKPKPVTDNDVTWTSDTVSLMWFLFFTHSFKLHAHTFQACQAVLKFWLTTTNTHTHLLLQLTEIGFIHETSLHLSHFRPVIPNLKTLQKWKILRQSSAFCFGCLIYLFSDKTIILQ